MKIRPLSAVGLASFQDEGWLPIEAREKRGTPLSCDARVFCASTSNAPPTLVTSTASGLAFFSLAAWADRSEALPAPFSVATICTQVIAPNSALSSAAMVVVSSVSTPILAMFAALNAPQYTSAQSVVVLASM